MLKGQRHLPLLGRWRPGQSDWPVSLAPLSQVRHARRSLTRSSDYGSLPASYAAKGRRPAEPERRGQSWVVVPPAAEIFSTAEAENACALIRSPRTASPDPSTFTSSPRRTAPRAARSSGVMSPPSGYRAARRSRLTTWYVVLNRALEKPFSLGSLRCNGIWPPSNAGEMLPLALLPLVPRPAVLPLDASPRPTRVLAVRAPGAGRR